jgi:adenosine deaminase
MYEDRPYELLKQMAEKGVLVEIAFTSNAFILGMDREGHPFLLYRKFGVPVAIATDDEGVSRIDLTHEYQHAVETFGLSYAELKQLVRNSLEYSFLPGGSLFEDRGAYARPAAACGKDKLGADKPTADCAAFIEKSEKAKQQWELERRFRAFEQTF